MIRSRSARASVPPPSRPATAPRRAVSAPGAAGWTGCGPVSVHRWASGSGQRDTGPAFELVPAGAARGRVTAVARGWEGRGAAGQLRHSAPLPVVLGEAPDRGQRGSQLMAGIGHELPHPLLRPAGGQLGRGAGRERRLDLGQHGIERPAQPPDLGARIALRDAPGQVPGRDGPGGLLDVGQRAQARPDHRDPDDAQQDQQQHADDQVDGGQPADGVVGVGHVDADDEGAVGLGLGAGVLVEHREAPARVGGDPPAVVAGDGGDCDRLAGVGVEPGLAVRDVRAVLPELRGVVHRHDLAVADDGLEDVLLGRERAAEAATAKPVMLRDGIRMQAGELSVRLVEQVATEDRDAGHADHGQGDADQRQDRRDQLDPERSPAGQRPDGAPETS